MSSPAHAHLRAHTAQAHAALDARFADGFGDRARYAVYLLGMHRLVAAFEAAGPPQAEPRLPPLSADLEALGLGPLPPATIAFAGDAERLGGQYVIDGSTLGARVLLRQVQAAGLAPGARRFLTQHTQAPARWRGTLAQLASCPDAALPALGAGAARMFELADASFALAEQELNR